MLHKKITNTSLSYPVKTSSLDLLPRFFWVLFAFNPFFRISFSVQISFRRKRQNDHKIYHECIWHIIYNLYRKCHLQFVREFDYFPGRSFYITTWSTESYTKTESRVEFIFNCVFWLGDLPVLNIIAWIAFVIVVWCFQREMLSIQYMTDGLLN